MDNDTYDDWAETRITVITGKPITFSTDLAEIRRPARRWVNIVAGRATGAVVTETDLPVAGGERPITRRSQGAGATAGAVGERAD